MCVQISVSLAFLVCHLAVFPDKAIHSAELFIIYEFFKHCRQCIFQAEADDFLIVVNDLSKKDHSIFFRVTQLTALACTLSNILPWPTKWDDVRFCQISMKH